MATSLKTLIVEDSADDALLLTMELCNAGFEPQCQRVETEADFRACLNPQLDVIFSDYSLPGFSAQRALKILHESRFHIPFIVVSGAMKEEAMVECMKLGASDCLVKDRLAGLGSVVRRVLEERRLRGKNRRAEAAP